MKAHILSTYLVGLALSSATHAIQPMNESDMGSVSADAGVNILNIYGASAAGLRADIDGSDASSDNTLTVQKYKEGSTTVEFASNELKNIQDGRHSVTQNTTNTDSVTTENVEDNHLVVGEAQAFTTTSEINYKEKNVHHEMRELGQGRVAISRDLHIDLLKIENLSGDHYDQSRSAGSIYLSDWISRGDTRLTPR